MRRARVFFIAVLLVRRPESERASADSSGCRTTSKGEASDTIFDLITKLRRGGEPVPSELGFSMPGEWEEHAATWLGWPRNPTDWPGKLDTIRWVYGEIVRKLAEGERVRILVDSRREARLARRRLALAGAELGRVHFVVHPTNRGWTRDSGLIFVRRRKGNRAETAIVHFHFNAWAKYDDWQQSFGANYLLTAIYKFW